ncbi:nitroreductase family protein [Intrasporangium sp. YIM S08009]|uniref:nitroreductase family protein n=1 Tax=Intrasporangium zincisolvens TaxID=3080018 RepID=UPI002B0554D6|nr:nitroreductase family protein [Intrasporangium sp. YIM S08009]
MEFTQVVRARRMSRRYDPDRPVPREVVERCLDNAVRAPSAGFSQGWDFLVLSTDAERRVFWDASAEPDASSEPDASGDDPWLAGIKGAPVLVLCLSDKDAYLDRYAAPDKGWTDRDEARWPVPYWDVDTGMAALLVLLTATDEGLGSLFFGVPAPRHPAVKAALDIPDARRIVGVVSLGYVVPGPKSPSLRRHRRTGSEVAHWGRFGVAGEPT